MNIFSWTNGTGITYHTSLQKRKTDGRIPEDFGRVRIQIFGQVVRIRLALGIVGILSPKRMDSRDFVVVCQASEKVCSFALNSRVKNVRKDLQSRLGRDLGCTILGSMFVRAFVGDTFSLGTVVPVGAGCFFDFKLEPFGVQGAWL